MKSNKVIKFISDLEFEYMGVAIHAIELAEEELREQYSPMEKFCQQIASLQKGCAPLVGFMDELIEQARKTINNDRIE